MYSLSNGLFSFLGLLLSKNSRKRLLLLQRRDIFPIFHQIRRRYIRIVVSRPFFGQAKPSCYDIVQLYIRFRRLELDRFCRAIYHASVAAFARMIPDGTSIGKGNVFAWTDPAADFTTDARIGRIKTFIEFPLDIYERGHHFRVQPPGNRRHPGIGLRFPAAISFPILFDFLSARGTMIRSGGNGSYAMH